MPKASRLLAIILSLVIFSAGESRADSSVAAGAVAGAMTMPGERCRADAKSDWSSAEKWAWKKICAGDTADMAAFAPGPTDPKTTDPWPDGRKLSVRFLDTILLVEPWRSAIPNSGVTIDHAHFAGSIDLSDATLIRSLWLWDSRFDSSVEMASLHSSLALSFQGSKFDDEINLQRAQIDGSVFLTDVKAKTVSMTAARINANLYLERANVTGDINLPVMTFGAGIYMIGTDVGGVLNISGSHIGDMVDLNGVHVTGNVNLQRMVVTGALFAKPDDNGRPCLFDGGVDMLGATIGGGAEFVGATVHGEMGMEQASIGGNLWLAGDDSHRGQFDDVTMEAGHIGTHLLIHQADFHKRFSLNGTHIVQNVEIDKGVEFFDRVEMGTAKVDGDIELDNTTFDQPVDLHAIQVGTNLQTGANTRFDKDINLALAHIGAALLIEGGEFHQPVRINDAHIGQNLGLSNGAKFLDLVQMIRTKVDGNIEIADTTFTGLVDMTAIEVGANLQIDANAQFDGTLNLAFAHIGANLDLTNGTFSTVDLTGATIVSEIRLGTPTSKSPNWHDPYKLTLRNVTAGSLQDLPESRPHMLDLEGFTFSRIGGFGAPVENLGDRDTSEFTDWLDQESPYSPQSYMQLATVFRSSGYPDKADWILFRGKLREMFHTLDTDKHVPRPDQFFFAFIYCITTGFGIYPQLAAIWVILFIVLGAWIFGRDKEEKLVEMNWGDRAIYSLDMLIPVVHLRGKNYTFEPKSNHIRYYLYVHRFIGFLLATVLIASLSHGSVEFH